MQRSDARRCSGEQTPKEPPHHRHVDARTGSRPSWHVRATQSVRRVAHSPRGRPLDRGRSLWAPTPAGNTQGAVMDTLTPAQRSARMALVRSRDTKPEIHVRRLVHRMGYRYRLHRRDLPGTPDLAFPSLRKTIFVHGCFWHGHKCQLGDRLPKSRVQFWSHKIAENAARDKRQLRKIRDRGWKALVIWECQLGRPALAAKIKGFLDA